MNHQGTKDTKGTKDEAYQSDARAGWDVQYAEMAAAGDDRLLDGDQLNATRWDRDEWEW